MPLSEAERDLISATAVVADPTRRRQAVATVLHKQNADAAAARALLAQSFLQVTQPSFHLIPRGTAMASQRDFTAAYDALAAATGNFADTEPATLRAALLATPAALSALRMVAGLTLNELAVAIRLVEPGSTVSGEALRKFERGGTPSTAPNARRSALVVSVVAGLTAVMRRGILTVPLDAQPNFHSKLDRPDTAGGWASVSEFALAGVPYSALLYQRYVGGQWRQVQDAYSEVKGKLAGLRGTWPVPPDEPDDGTIPGIAGGED